MKYFFLAGIDIGLTKKSHPSFFWASYDRPACASDWYDEDVCPALYKKKLILVMLLLMANIWVLSIIIREYGDNKCRLVLPEYNLIQLDETEPFVCSCLSIDEKEYECVVVGSS